MLPILIHAVDFYVNLLSEDLERANALWGTICPRCREGVLHWGAFKRTPRGHPPGFERYEGWNERFSLCCSVCRGRVMPESSRFLGRKVYMAPAVAACAAATNVDAEAFAWLKTHHRLHRRTVVRWRAWWTTAFVRTQLWKALRARFRAPVDESRLPASLFDAYGRTLEGLRNLLTDLAPITIESASAQAQEGQAM